MRAATFVMIGTMTCSAAYAQGPIEDQQSGSRPAAARPAPDARRDDIRTMEGLLTQALQRGAQELARQLRMSEPNSAFVTGTGRARGFLLDGYGIFFDVDVPGMKQSVVWSAQMVQLLRDRESAMQFLASGNPDERLRKLAEGQLRRIEQLMTAAQTGQVLVPSPTQNTQMAPPAPGTAVAAVADSVTPAIVTAPAGGGTPSRFADLLPVLEVRDPNELYTESVKNALIDAMLKHSAFLKIGENEWLTVAASDSEGPQMPGQLDDASRIVIRIKGADLAAFQAGKLTREEMLKRVEVREF